MCEAISNASIITALIVDMVVVIGCVLLFISFSNGNGPDQPA